MKRISLAFAMLSLIFQGNAFCNQGLYESSEVLEGIELTKNLSAAASEGDINQITDLINKKGSGLHFNINPALQAAAENGHEDVIRILITEFKADPKIKFGGHRETALHLAARQGHESSVRELYKQGADLMARLDFFLETPLHTAVKHNQLEVVELIIDLNPATIHATSRFLPGSEDWLKVTPIDFALAQGRDDMLRAFLNVPIQELQKWCSPIVHAGLSKILEVTTLDAVEIENDETNRLIKNTYTKLFEEDTAEKIASIYNNYHNEIPVCDLRFY